MRIILPVIYSIFIILYYIQFLSYFISHYLSIFYRFYFFFGYFHSIIFSPYSISIIDISFSFLIFRRDEGKRRDDAGRVPGREVSIGPLFLIIIDIFCAHAFLAGLYGNMWYRFLTPSFVLYISKHHHQGLPWTGAGRSS
jgi:hypothetical protein